MNLTGCLTAAIKAKEIDMSEQNKTFGDLANLCFDLNSPDFHVFLRMNGHVDSFDLEVFHGGWSVELRGNSESFSRGFAYFNAGNQDVFSRAIEWLKIQHNENKEKIENFNQIRENIDDAINNAKKLGLTDEQINLIKKS